MSKSFSSRTQSPARASGVSPANFGGISTVQTQPSLFENHLDALPGSLNDSAMVRAVLIQSIRNCDKSRAQIAEDITFYSGREVTEISLNKFTAESRTDYRWPAELDRALTWHPNPEQIPQLTQAARPMYGLVMMAKGPGITVNPNFAAAV